MGLEEAWKTEAAAARAAFAAREQSRTRKKGSVAQLDASNFASSLAAVERVGVVKFFSPQCPACRRLAPVYEAAAKRFSGQADFFEVNYKQAQQVCREERVLLLPMVHLYVPRAGCVDRFVLSYKRRKRLEEKLDGLLAGEGERLDRLRELDPAALAPLVRLKELLGAVQAVRRAPELLRGAAGDGWVTEQQTEEMQSVFRALDRNGDGVLDAEELAAACEALGMPFSSEEELRRVVTAADGDASTDTVDERAFLRLMARRASEEVTDADALLSSFRALDVDGNGLLDAGELLEALSGVSLALGGEEAAGGAVSRAGIEELLRAFGVDDESGSVDYETFVSMVAGRGS